MRVQLLALAGFVTAGALLVSLQLTATRASSPFPPIAVAPSPVPTDIPGGAGSATLQQAAAFAWQEFIALNWPAQAGKRDTPDATCRFADPRCAQQPRVWETFRSKIEIFPNQGTPVGYSATAPDFGYDAPPAADYTGYLSNATVCKGQTKPAQAAWINLDETDQITIDQMYAGVGPASSPINSQPQLVRFLAKANRAEYTYVAQSQWWTVPGKLQRATLAYLTQNKKDPPPGSTTLVSLPNNAIEMKAGWRLLTPAEARSGRYHMQRVRYYEPFGNGTCYHELPNAAYHDTWFGLVALHIIQKTPSAPYFIYATFEQADNIVAPGPNGNPIRIEKDDGALAVTPTCPPGRTAPCQTNPLEILVDGPTPQPGSSYPPQIVLQTPSPRYCGPLSGPRPKNQLYFLEQNPSASYKPMPDGGFICVVQRANPIPREIIAVNDAAQNAIATYLGGAASPWTHYKLVNVQYRPYSNTTPGVPFPGRDPSTGNNPANFYLANIVVETNRSLQLFQGGLVNSVIETTYASQFPPFTGTGVHTNTTFNGMDYNMGGCMGCHGSQGQHSGGQFSVILARGGAQNLAPEAPHPIGTTLPAALRRLRYNRVLVNH